MSEQRVTNNRTGQTIVSNLRTADTFFSRLKGLMGKSRLPKGYALRIVPCNSIHSFFMRMDIDVLFLDGDHKVLHTMMGMRPWRMSPWVRGAKSVLEAPAGSFEGTVEVGDVLQFHSKT